MIVSAAGIALISAIIAASANIIVAPLASRYGTYMISVILSAALAAIFVLLSPLAIGRPEGNVASPKGVLYIVLGAAPILALGTLLYWESVRRMGVSTAFPIASSYPLVTSFFGFFFLGEAITLVKVLGTLAILLGITLISRSKSTAALGQERRGRSFLIAYLAMLCWAVNTILIKLAVDSGLGVYAVNVLRMPVITILLASILAARGRHYSPTRIPFKAILVLLLAAAINGIQDLLYFYTLQTSSLSIVVPLASTSPLFVMPMAVLFLKEPVTVRLSAGTLATVVGIIALM